MVNNLISTKRTTTCHLDVLNTKKITTYGVGNPSPCLGQVQTCGGAKSENKFPKFRQLNPVILIFSPFTCRLQIFWEMKQVGLVLLV